MPPIPPGPRPSRYAHQWTFKGERHLDNQPHDSTSCVLCLVQKLLMATCDMQGHISTLVEYNSAAQTDPKFDDDDGTLIRYALDQHAEAGQLLDRIFTLYGRPEPQPLELN